MKWLQYSLKTNLSSTDIVAATLEELGVEGVEIDDGLPPSKEELEEMFADFIPEVSKEDDSAVIRFYLKPGRDAEILLGKIRAALEELRNYSDIGECVITVREMEDQDWQNNWKAFFHSFTVDNIHIVPSWEEEGPSDGYDFTLHMDPGTAFGTGLHETTQLCIKGLKKAVFPGCALLDVGTGSGILGIIALKYGAGRVTATDIDLNTVSAVRENLAVNDIRPDRFRLLIGNILEEEAVRESVGYEQYDIVTANILAPVLISLAGVIAPHMRREGILITSGILEGQEAEVRKALTQNGFEVTGESRDGEWVSLTAVRKSCGS